MEIYKKDWIKYSIGFVMCLLVRLLPFRPPNIEPLLVTQMPFSKTYGSYASFLFGFLSIILYDSITSTLGIWTLVTATTYGLLGIWASSYFNNKNNSPRNYALFALMGTLAFDAITGLCIGPLFFHQSFMVALIGQIPFTALHLAGNISFALVLSPLIYRLTQQSSSVVEQSLIILKQTHI